MPTVVFFKLQGFFFWKKCFTVKALLNKLKVWLQLHIKRRCLSNINYLIFEAANKTIINWNVARMVNAMTSLCITYFNLMILMSQNVMTLTIANMINIAVHSQVAVVTKQRIVFQKYVFNFLKLYSYALCLFKSKYFWKLA